MFVIIIEVDPSLSQANYGNILTVDSLNVAAGMDIDENRFHYCIYLFFF